MENPVYEAAEKGFKDILGFPYRRTLPEKIIRLRKISQECHVRRMKIALQKRQIQGTEGMSDLRMGFSTSSINRISSSPGAGTNSRNIRNSFDGNKSEVSSSKVSDFSPEIQSFKDGKRDCRSRFTNVNRYEKADNFSAERSAVMSDTALDLCCRKKSMIHPNCKINKMFNSATNNDKPDKTPDVKDGRKINDKQGGRRDKNQTDSDVISKGNTSSKSNLQPFNNIMDSVRLNRLKMKKDKDQEDSLKVSLENIRLKDARNRKIEKRCPNTSKIPILQSRLFSGKKNKLQKSLQKINIRKPNKKSTGNIQHSSYTSNDRDFLENSPAKTPEIISKSPSETSLNLCAPQDFEYNPVNNFCNESGFEGNTTHPVLKWLQDTVAKAEKSNRITHVSPVKSLTVDFERSTKNLNLKASATPETKVFKTESSLTYSVKDSSDESSDCYYETETGDSVLKKDTNSSDEDENAWLEDSDDDSTALPADAEDEIIKSTPDNHPKNYDAPDYPKTPYDLRYPRYYKRDYKDNLRKTEETSTQSKKKSSKKSGRRG